MQKLKFNYTQLTDIGLVRKANEDNVGNALTPNGHVFTVCDGMGGHVGGATASAMAVQGILEFFLREKYENINLAIEKAISFANEQIYAHSQNNLELRGMGTTCTVVVIGDSDVRIGHVGDSRIYFRTAGKLRRITHDHSFVQTLVNQGIISDADAEQHPRKNELLLALGIKSEVKPTISSYPINPCSGDILMLCSDGLCGLVNDMTIESIILKANNLDNAASHLINAAKNAGGYDNITVQLIQFTDSPYSFSVFEDLSPKELLDTGNQDFTSTQTIKRAGNTKFKLWLKRKKYFIIGVTSIIAIVLAITLDLQCTEKDSNQGSNTEPEVKENIIKTQPQDTQLEEPLVPKEDNKVSLSVGDSLITKQ